MAATGGKLASGGIIGSDHKRMGAAARYRPMRLGGALADPFIMAMCRVFGYGTSSRKRGGGVEYRIRRLDKEEVKVSRVLYTLSKQRREAL